MTTSSEDVLLQVSEVRYKKGDGTLYIMNERLAWIADNRDTVAVSHRFADIKTQKISPEGKPKVQLQIVLHDGNNSTFHFVNKNGYQAILADRDKVKDLLQQLLPNFKRKVDKELEEKNRVLSENPNLLQLYKDLVITQIITSDEFWDTYAKDYKVKQAQEAQDVGVSAAFLVDIKPQTDGCNGLKYNLTAEIIHSIFKTYPAVKRKHQENVPGKLTESEFWTKFFQSHYFHRDRLTAGTKDIFAECGKIDDQTLKAAVKKVGDPLLDLRRFEDVALEEGFCSVSDDTNRSNSGNIVHQNMIKRFNQHSMMVLSTCVDVLSESNSAATGPVPSITNGSTEKSTSKPTKFNGMRSPTPPSISDEPTAVKRQRILDKIGYDDLGKTVLDETKKIAPPPILKIDRKDRYFNGPIPASNSETHEDPRRWEELQYQLMRLTETMSQRTPHKAIVSSNAAVNALGDLSPGGAMMRGFQGETVTQMVPPEFEKDLRTLYFTLMSLLKQFWKCFSPATPQNEEQIVRMHEALQRFKMAKLVPFENRALRELLPLGASMTQHLNSLLQVANSKFATWQERKMRQHR